MCDNPVRSVQASSVALEMAVAIYGPFPALSDRSSGYANVAQIFLEGPFGRLVDGWGWGWCEVGWRGGIVKGHGREEICFVPGSVFIDTSGVLLISECVCA